LIDFHCHIDLYPDPVAVVGEVARRGIKVLAVTTTPLAWEGTSSLAAKSHNLITAVGIHPEIAHTPNANLQLFDEIVEKTRYVGEIGLDGTPPYKEYKLQQDGVFQHVLASSARAGGRILSVHSRWATGRVLEALSQNKQSGVPVMHWFSGSLSELSLAVELGCWFSVGPSMLSSQRGRSLAALMPRDRVLTETDGPFTMFSGKALFPWDSNLAVQRLSQIWGIDIQEVHKNIDLNLDRLLRII
jgi:TatD DNase family protein